MRERDNKEILQLQTVSKFEERKDFEGTKNIHLCNDQPLKYTALIVNSDLDLQIHTTQE